MAHPFICLVGVAVLVCGGIPAPEKKAPGSSEGHYIKVELKGRLANKPAPKIARMIVINESHDAVVLVSTESWRLVFPQQQEIREAARKLDGKTVVVTGMLELREAFGRVDAPSATGSGRQPPPSSPLPPLYVVRVTSLKAAKGE